jgi:lipid II isoglutaminyl synthase (glutamine-hydrolysing)
MMNILIIFLGKLISRFSTLLNLGNGSTWPGHIALKFNPNLLKEILNKSNAQIILITGTNGKTTTAKLLQTILERNKQSVFINHSGANLLNGIASSIIQAANFNAALKFDFAIFEIDENTLPQITSQIEPDYIIALNLFRDQLDRYGEVNTIAKNWKITYEKLINTKLILNADDPQIAFLGNKNAYYFGLNDKLLATNQKQHAADSTLCPNCLFKLEFKTTYFSHLGEWNCPKCKLHRPKLDLDKFDYYPLSGTYAIYDTLASVLTAKLIGINQNQIKKALKLFNPAFGRQEKLLVKGKTIQLFLSKNPTSFNESLKTINQNNPKNLLIVLNDKIPDGTDISWIWDIDFEDLLNKNTKLFLCGDRVYDLALRIKYATQIKNSKFKIQNYTIFENLQDAISKALDNSKPNETLYILPTYSAMLDARKILTGKKIL